MRHKNATEIARHLALVLANLHVPEDADVPELVADWWALHPWVARDGFAVSSAILADEELRHMVRAFDVRHNQVGINSVEEGLMATVGEWWEERAAIYAC